MKLMNLNDREIELLTWVARGQTSAQIACKLDLAKRTVDFHIDNEAAIKAAAGGLIKP